VPYRPARRHDGVPLIKVFKETISNHDLPWGISEGYLCDIKCG
jgi:hypothetical protein